ncbi:pLS20_p028 family conjugation system transmembrane protein [Priestia megaterium]|uniref:pLS20_p028 family conjugation system transmembrane protein n=1 Tax=Priestia megaterium TaxID=1404 RepID=UPI003F8010F6
MKDEEILKKLHEFADYLDKGNIASYLLRKIGWGIIQVLSFLIDSLEGITDNVLGIKLFFNSPAIQDFIKEIQPFLYILWAFSFLYIGYMLIIHKKVNREQIMINIFISMAVLLLLNTGMVKADKFTDQAIDAVDLDGDSTISEKIIKQNITDVAQFDVNDWKTPKLKEPNKVPQNRIDLIDITEKIDGDFKVNEKDKISDEGQKILSHKAAITPDGKEGLVKLENGWFDFFPELYYRWHWNFWTIAISLFVTGMTMLFTSIKLAKLCYELGFNAILAQLVAPADVGDGQKLKTVLQNILNTFLVIIMIFISMKVYLMGTVFISDKLEGIPYLVALIAFSIAVVDGPVMCERLFGIDAGLKSGWGAVAGGLAMMKGMESTMNGAKGTFKNATDLAKGIGGLGKGAAGSALQAAAGLGGLGKGLVGSKGNNGQQSSLHEEMKKAGVGGGNGKDASKGQQGGDMKQGAATGRESGQQEDGQKGNVNYAQGKGEQQGNTAIAKNGGSSLHEEMQTSSYDDNSSSEGTSSSVENRGASLHEEMQASSYDDNSSSGGTSSSVENGGASLHEEMQASDYDDNSSSGGTSSSVENGGASLHEEMQASGYGDNSPSEGTSSSVENGGASLHEEMQASGYDDNSSSEGTSSSVENGGASLHEEMQASGNSGSPSENSSSIGSVSTPVQEKIQTSGNSGSTSESSSSIGSVSTPVQEGIQTSGYGGSPSEGNSSIGSVSTPVQEEIQTSGYSESISQGESFVENSTAPATSQHEPPIIMPRGMDQAQRQVAATQEPRQEKETVKQDQIPASTNDIPMPHQNRTETRNIAHVVRDNVKGKIGNVKNRIESSPTLHKTKRSYQIGRNTGQDLRKLVSKKQKKLDEK